MAKRKITIFVDPVEIGAKGGKARASRLSDEQLSAASSVAAKARWEAYYAAHPEKLKARLEREARKGARPRGRPRKKKSN